VDVPRTQVSDIEWFGRRAEVAVSVHEALHHSVDRGDHRVASNVELAVVNQQGLVQVFLHDRSPAPTAAGEYLDFLSDLIQRAGDFDTGASV